METKNLIDVLASDARRTGRSLSSVWWCAMGLAVALTATIFFAAFSIRPDIALAVQSPRFLLKLALMGTLTTTAFGLMRVLSRPGEHVRKQALYLMAGPTLLTFAVGIEIYVLPPKAWQFGILAANGVVCAASILLLGIGPLAIFLIALRHGAPTRPAVAGAVAGMLAGGIGATFFAFACVNDSPLFIATWYGLAVVILALLVAVGAKRFPTW